MVQRLPVEIFRRGKRFIKWRTRGNDQLEFQGAANQSQAFHHT